MGPSQCLARDSMPQTEKSAVEPIKLQSEHHAQIGLSAAVTSVAPRMSSEDVLAFMIEHGHARALLRAEHSRSQLFDELRVVVEMTLTGGCVVAGIDQLLERVVPHGVQHPV